LVFVWDGCASIKIRYIHDEGTGLNLAWSLGLLKSGGSIYNMVNVFWPNSSLAKCETVNYEGRRGK
jgi:hypothetical protein